MNMYLYHQHLYKRHYSGIQSFILGRLLPSLKPNLFKYIWNVMFIWSNNVMTFGYKTKPTNEHTIGSVELCSYCAVWFCGSVCLIVISNVNGDILWMCGNVSIDSYTVHGRCTQYTMTLTYSRSSSSSFFLFYFALYTVFGWTLEKCFFVPIK